MTSSDFAIFTQARVRARKGGKKEGERKREREKEESKERVRAGAAVHMWGGGETALRRGGQPEHTHTHTHTHTHEQRVEADGVVVSQLCDEEGNLNPKQFEAAMRKQARERDVRGRERYERERKIGSSRRRCASRRGRGI